MTALHYIGGIIGVIGFAFMAYGDFKDTIRHMTIGAFLVIGGFLTVGIAGLPIKEKPSVKVGQVWLIGDEDPFKCDTVRVMRISHGHVKYVGLKELRTEEMMAELDSLLDAKGTLLYSADYSSCSIEKFVIDGRRVK